MMKMNFSFKSAGLVKSVLPSLMLVLVFVFSGISLSAQSVSATASTNNQLVKTYGDNFMDQQSAAITVKNAIKQLQNTPPLNPTQETQQAVEMIFADGVVHSLGEGVSVSNALSVGYTQASNRLEDFLIDVDIAPIFEKYYALLTL